MTQKRSKPGKQRPVPPPARATTPAAPGPRSLVALTLLGLASALWAAFLWRQLVVSRTGGTPVCGPGDDAQCAELWDAAFASSVQRWTGVPVAGWGLAWGLVASLLPLLAWLKRDDEGARARLVSAIKWTAAGGAAAVLLLLAASAAQRAFCLPCLGSHIVAVAYAGVALFGWSRVGWPERGRGLGYAAGLTVAALLVLLYPGSRTPAARAELAELVPRPSSTPPPDPSPTSGGREVPVPESAPTPAVVQGDRNLDAFVASLAPPLQQGLSDALAVYRAAPEHPPTRSRFILGPMAAPVRITEFTDVLCPHCAELHRTLEYLQETTPSGSFQIEPRQYPLDAACNPEVRRGGQPVRCLAAKVQICMEGRPGAFAFTGALFRSQRELTEERVYALAAPHIPRAELDTCLASAATQSKLQEDIREAGRHSFEGTPLVLVNGRKGSPFGAFLYAIVLSRGLPWHPAFNMLPPPRPAAHAH